MAVNIPGLLRLIFMSACFVVLVEVVVAVFGDDEEVDCPENDVVESSFGGDSDGPVPELVIDSWKNERGDVPPLLQELSPELIPETPVDPFLEDEPETPVDPITEPETPVDPFPDSPNDSFPVLLDPCGTDGGSRRRQLLVVTESAPSDDEKLKKVLDRCDDVVYDLGIDEKLKKVLDRCDDVVYDLGIVFLKPHGHMTLRAGPATTFPDGDEADPCPIIDFEARKMDTKAISIVQGNKLVDTSRGSYLRIEGEYHRLLDTVKAFYCAPIDAASGSQESGSGREEKTYDIIANNCADLLQHMAAHLHIPSGKLSKEAIAYELKRVASPGITGKIKASEYYVSLLRQLLCKKAAQCDTNCDAVQEMDDDTLRKFEKDCDAITELSLIEQLVATRLKSLFEEEMNSVCASETA